MKPIAVLLVEDHTIVREGLSKLIGADLEIKVVGQACDGREGVILAKQLSPDVVLMDIAMPLLNGLEATRQILKAVPSIRVLILSAHNDEAYVHSAINASAMGFLLKQTSAQDVCRAIKEVQKGNNFFSPSLAKRAVARSDRSPDRKGDLKPRNFNLSEREAEVLQLIAEGKANKETASQLNISIKTVEKHRENLMAKLGIHDTAGLTRYAIQSGVIESSVQVTIL